MTARGGWVAGCTCSGFDTRMDRLFVRFTNCCFGSECHMAWDIRDNSMFVNEPMEKVKILVWSNV